MPLLTPALDSIFLCKPHRHSVFQAFGLLPPHLREQSTGAVAFFSGFELAIDKLCIDGAG
jgi:hypothetical protein